MSEIQTVRGQVDSADLGVTLMHEHVFVLTADVQTNYPGEWGSEEDRITDAVTKLQKAYDAGVRTIVDPTVVGLGRYIPRIQTIAEQVPLNIVVATGVYTYTEVPFFFDIRGPALNELVGAEVPDPMVEMFIGDIRDGIAGTGVKAGMLKCAIEHQGLTPGVERVMRAVAKTHVETGVPITVHTHPDTKAGLHVKQVMVEEEGVDPGRIVLGHSGDTTDCDHLTELAEAGFILGFDRFGINTATTFEARADTLIEMVRRGYAEQIVVSQDASCYIDWIQPEVMAYLPQWHYTHLLEDVFPYALERGVTQADIDTMLVDVPRRILSGE
ncbi:phosphotriesterase [Gordonia sp. (in: high G+C Gram-positive bacteria)]|jgi:phosphotriesterase-related protein|uniref:phosphotriesterase family protein n=1 Tax=Gordonia sp. (in: high G+C Gram-positive bacteria) TaxID=84139 RepID=UPI001E152535|nr:phosphotriesterase-related protein [Gordonia sp. (in: high G+C Gram-positive bacteria)]MCB1297216.1 phosphotriesterase [Gordonia sp. (in: high G+C Gram-positive bacteria)]HMS73782.1 phosphotriesterase-related protein [Gordonia sp. (in: high G+C Gram-positive bacteria)]HQV16933.1 phosphotriesterase-related protein [Gordonia sp. (in: high G+C Gram-positive bacteria)]